MPFTITPSWTRAAGTRSPASRLVTAAASWCSLMRRRTRLTGTPRASPHWDQSSHSPTSASSGSAVAGPGDGSRTGASGWCACVVSLTRQLCHRLESGSRAGSPAGGHGCRSAARGHPSEAVTGRTSAVDRGADPLVGRVLDGRYRVTRRVARGGMATVYEAHDLRLQRDCAVKVMHNGLGDDQAFAARFVREAHSAAR